MCDLDHPVLVGAKKHRHDITNILIDNGSQAEILFLIAFNRMGFDPK
jgi:hypothetical protein